VLEKGGEDLHCTHSVRNEDVLRRVKEYTKHPTYNKRTKTDWINHILLRKCLIKHIMEGKIKGKEEEEEEEEEKEDLRSY
jgi:hypothetical protein